MRKYLNIFKATVNDNIQYVSEILLQFVGFASMIFILSNLWTYVYEGETSRICGYSLSMMVWYVLFAEVLWTSMRNKKLNVQIKSDVTGGNIAYKINKPYLYPLYVISKYLGDIFIKSILLVFISILLGFLLIGRLETFRFESIPFVLITSIMAIMLNAFMRVTINLLAFWIEDSTPFLWIFDKLILVFGTIFPLEMFPSILQKVLAFSPVYTIVYGPTKLLIEFDINLFFKVLLVQVIELIISISLCFFVYTKGVKKVNVNGG